MASTLPKNQLFEALMGHDAQWTAIAHANSHDSFTYGRLVKDVAAGRKWLEQLADSRKQDGKSKADGRCIAFMVENRYDYVGARPIEFSLLCIVKEMIHFDVERLRQHLGADTSSK